MIASRLTEATNRAFDLLGGNLAVLGGAVDGEGPPAIPAQRTPLDTRLEAMPGGPRSTCGQSTRYDDMGPASAGERLSHRDVHDDSV
jgi:hypothetical protein